MLSKPRFFHVGPKGVVYNEKYFGTKASFNSYIEGFEKFTLDEDEDHVEHTKRQVNADLSSTRLVMKDGNSQSETASQKKKGNLLPVEKDSKTTVPTKSFTKVGREASEALQQLGKGNNLEKFLEAHGLSNAGFSVSELKPAFDKFLSKQEEIKQQNEISKWTTQLENLKALRDEKELQKWLESKGVPAANVSIAAVQKELQKYFQNSDPIERKGIVRPKIGQPTWGKRTRTEKPHTKKGESALPAVTEEKTATVSKMKELLNSEKFLDIDITTQVDEIPVTKMKVPRDFGPCMRVEDFNGRSLLLQEDTLAHRLWEDFKGMSAGKQIAVVVGITVVTAALGFVSWRILLLAFPSVFQVNQYWAEVLSQWFIQRQESTFHLLQHTAQNSKPLSTAWANQYLLWKYI